MNPIILNINTTVKIPKTTLLVNYKEMSQSELKYLFTVCLFNAQVKLKLRFKLNFKQAKLKECALFVNKLMSMRFNFNECVCHMYKIYLYRLKTRLCIIINNLIIY
jgi:hypothetical protein